MQGNELVQLSLYIHDKKSCFVKYIFLTSPTGLLCMCIVCIFYFRAAGRVARPMADTLVGTRCRSGLLPNLKND